MFVKDPDEGANGDVTCEMSHAHFRFSKIEGDNYKVVTSHELDREAIAEYSLEVVCRDGGRPQRRTRTQIQVTALLRPVTLASLSLPALREVTQLLSTRYPNRKSDFLGT